ncbi:MAG: serine/threonine-protein kinase RsbT [Epulopiscium sp.]|jgi:anti-sigma regulatory factor (Ser/Thr protein kinase)|uniref:Anti-sigma regulatory factor n=1 Tax=Defluviitalea raffinosedens TaxID=1450156 RepID=A0A7C8HG66_9FIRM|nr:ATP-binding protein [Defluviitalea raffinosedens]MBZ4668171.1 Anti-sigma regulatory factor [Defluviitaleaceae bacterium]MDK2788903.1 serine/threonine-protein kinase RsbT [Candidatus Epulonipiscium sp.]KAE9636947.1 anti-sigma regulatory factor [Defluviitalea raffinosedens]MBM7685302.1 anti-sigma regulatory factor (Ser/Thr protein kinase) [Defluviitalea raffinosedens]HHW67259.1 anti-sigma regulatory factor [Candidatus Epulonipiscium sp.]
MNLSFKVDGDEFTLAGESSSQVKKVLKQLGIAPEIIRKIAIAMYEAEINMVIHANGGTIDVEITPEKVYIVLKDTGPGIPDIDLAMQEGYSTASEQVRELGFGAGMGLPNMKKYSDNLKVTSEVGKGTTVEITVYI